MAQGADRDQDPALPAELAQDVARSPHCTSALDNADIARADHLISVSGERSNSTSSSKSNKRSSMSRNEVWQPKQPATRSSRP